MEYTLMRDVKQGRFTILDDMQACRLDKKTTTNYFWFDLAVLMDFISNTRIVEHNLSNFLYSAISI